MLVAALRLGDRARAGWAAVGLQGAPGSRKLAGLEMRVQEYKLAGPLLLQVVLKHSGSAWFPYCLGLLSQRGCRSE